MSGSRETQPAPCEHCRARPRMRGFTVCDECWTEMHKHETPQMPWEAGA
jgi:hypothetical protein